MGNNLPDHVRPGDPDAPWNQNHPEPKYWCPYDPEIGFMRHDISDHWPDDWTKIQEYKCPECGKVVNARRHSIVQQYLEAWRNSPETMENAIDEYSELKEVPEA